MSYFCLYVVLVIIFLVLFFVLEVLRGIWDVLNVYVILNCEGEEIKFKWYLCFFLVVVF